MRYVALVMVLAACGSSDGPRAKQEVVRAPVNRVTADAAIAPADAGPALPAHERYDDLAKALAATIPDTARVLGFGELHARVDRAQVRSALSIFTQALPSFGDRVSDLVVETWVVDPKCGKQAVQATAKVEKTVKRPEATKSEISLLAAAARAANIQPHAMKLSCKDYEKVAPSKGEADPLAMLGITTRELSRITTSAVRYRDRQTKSRPWIVVYGGALHNDRFPAEGTAEWSYADTADLVTSGRFIEIDLIIPELAEANTVSQQQPWYPLAVAAGDQVAVYQRGERSFVVILPRSRR